MIDKSRFGDGFIWSPSICECECDKSCDIVEYLDYENCKYRKSLIDKLVLEYEEIECNSIKYNKYYFSS